MKLLCECDKFARTVFYDEYSVRDVRGYVYIVVCGDLNGIFY